MGSDVAEVQVDDLTDAELEVLLQVGFELGLRLVEGPAELP